MKYLSKLISISISIVINSDIKVYTHTHIYTQHINEVITIVVSYFQHTSNN